MTLANFDSVVYLNSPRDRRPSMGSAAPVTLAQVEGLFRGLLAENKPAMIKAAAVAGAVASQGVVDVARPGLMQEAARAGAESGLGVLVATRPGLMQEALTLSSFGGMNKICTSQQKADHSSFQRNLGPKIKVKMCPSDKVLIQHTDLGRLAAGATVEVRVVIQSRDD